MHPHDQRSSRRRRLAHPGIQNPGIVPGSAGHVSTPRLAARFPRTFGHSGTMCIFCPPHGRDVLYLGDGRWWDEDAERWRCGAGKRLRRMLPPHSVILPMRRTRMVLSTCQLDHDPTSNDGANLAALCQRCHILHDAPQH